jgi:hypothetical protein
MKSFLIENLIVVRCCFDQQTSDFYLRGSSVLSISPWSGRTFYPEKEH